MENLSNLDYEVDVLSKKIVVLKRIYDQVITRKGGDTDGWLEKVEGREREFKEIRKEIEILRRERYDDVNNLNVIETLSQKVIYNIEDTKFLRDAILLKAIKSILLHSNKLKPRQLSHVDLSNYTSDSSKWAATGGCSEIYRGQLDGMQVAIKVLKDDAVESFMAEMDTMVTASHPNLVTLYGYCFEPNMKALVYEYMKNGSLDKILFENHLNLEWGKLYRITIEIAKGLAYLHDGCDKQIIHRDMKPANVLIDENHSPKITDFGVAKLLGKVANRYTITQIQGTRGYAAPEFCYPTSLITKKCDVYSFGVMLYEVLTKRHNGGFDKEWFPVQIWKNFEMGQLDELIESFGIPEIHKGKAKILSVVAFWCSQYTVEIRPSMSTVVEILEKEISGLNPPPHPFEFHSPPLDFLRLPSQEIHSISLPFEEEEKSSDDEKEISVNPPHPFEFHSPPLDFLRLSPQEIHSDSEKSKNRSKIQMLLSRLSMLCCFGIQTAAPEYKIPEVPSLEFGGGGGYYDNICCDIGTDFHGGDFLSGEFGDVPVGTTIGGSGSDSGGEAWPSSPQMASSIIPAVLSEESKISSETQKLLSELMSGRPQQFSRSDIERVTSNFSEQIGSCRYGDVYKGQFLDGVKVAITKLRIDHEMLMNSVRIMGTVNHPNIVKLHGYCDDANLQVLVYEHVENGSLDRILYMKHLHIEWEKLYEIVIETAKGLSALHAVGIIHDDIKASNILLNSNVSPKIDCSGLQVRGDFAQTRIRGTPGYSAPERWIPTSVVTYKSDVYSFGMLLFEVLGRRRNLLGQKWFPVQVWKMFNEGQLSKMIEDCGINKKDREKAYNLSMVAFRCAQSDPKKRPTMNSVVNMLEMEIQVEDPPNPFPFASTELSFHEEGYALTDSDDDRGWDEGRELESMFNSFEKKSSSGGETSNSRIDGKTQ